MTCKICSAILYGDDELPCIHEQRSVNMVKDNVIDPGKLMIPTKSKDYENIITFNSSNKEMLKLDAKGFHYKDKLVEDAGEAHALFITFMQRANGGFIESRDTQLEYLCGSVSKLRLVMENVPELNMGNYSDDQVRSLNNALIEVNNILKSIKV